MQEVILHYRIRSNCACMTGSCLLGYILQHPALPICLPEACTGTEDPPPHFPPSLLISRCSLLVVILVLVAGVVIHVAPSPSRFVLILPWFSMLELGSRYPSGCRHVGAGLVRRCGAAHVV